MNKALSQALRCTDENPPFQAVCQRSINNNPEFYPSTEYQGGKFYFCTTFCLEAFLADPDRFYAAHSKIKK